MREQTALVERATEGLVEQLLPVLDSFELALANLDRHGATSENVRKGVELVYAELLGVLEKAGLDAHRGRGRAVRPRTSTRPCMQDDGDGEPVVADVLRTGYR